MVAVCSCCDLDLCEICGHGCDCHHDHCQHPEALTAPHGSWELNHDLAS